MSDRRSSDDAYRAIVNLIRTGVYPPGTRLPGERELAERIAVSRSTLRRALGRVAEEGAVVASPQRGWFVPQVVLGEPPSTLSSFTEMAASRGLRATARVLSREVRPATFAEAHELQIVPSAPVIELIRLRGMDCVPITVESALLALRGMEWLVDADLSDASLYQLLESHGVVLHRSAYTVQATTADDRDAELLDLAVGGAVLLARDVTYANDGRPVVVTVNHYRGDAYRFTADLFRTPA